MAQIASSQAAIAVPERQGSGLVSADVLMPLLVMVGAWVVYARLAVRLARGAYDDFDNPGFDFDASSNLHRLMGLFAGNYDLKHPFFPFLEVLTWPYLALGFDTRHAAGLAMATVGAIAVALVFRFLRTNDVAAPEAAALAVLYAVTCTPIYTSIIVETYGAAALTIVLTWLMARRRLDDLRNWKRARFLVAVATFGVTVTNLVQTIIVEGMAAWWHRGLRAVPRHLILAGLATLALIVSIDAILWTHALLGAIANPVMAVKEVYWQQTKGSTTGLGQLLITFFGFAYVAPHFDVFRLPEGIDMLDFRSLSFGALGWVALAGWMTFLLTGTVAAFRHPRYRIIATGISVAVLFNLMLHLKYQFRGSLFIYSGHLHFLGFALAAGLAPWVATARPRARAAYVGGTLVLAALVGTNNLASAASFVRHFDTVPVHHEPCQLPCRNLGSAPKG